MSYADFLGLVVATAATACVVVLVVFLCVLLYKAARSV